MPDRDPVQYREANGIAHFVFDRPHALNAMNVDVLRPDLN